MVIERLSALKKDVKQLFLDDCNNQEYVPIKEMISRLKMHSLLEKAVEKAIEQVKKRKA